jgi:ribosome-associated protein
MNAPLTDALIPFFTPIFERKALSVTALDVSALTSYTDTLIIVEAASSRQVTSIADHIVKQLKKSKIKTLGTEGIKEGEWALLDYGHAVIHVFDSQTKALYDLEGFWADAPRIDLSGYEPPKEGN